jgi:hypothetical protein
MELEPVGKVFVSVENQVNAIRKALQEQQTQQLQVVEEEKKE